MRKSFSLIELVPFATEKVVDADCVWLNRSKLKSGYTSYSDQKKLFEDLAYIAKPNDFFDDIKTDSDNNVVLNAEQYGGVGIGNNGGGARCGNIDLWQLKGIGVTPVVGMTDDLYNSSGIYPLYEAITEIVNYEIYNTILPMGTTEYYAVIHIGQSPYFVTAENNDTKQLGTTKLAILVREICLRMGHFLPARSYKPMPEYKNRVKSDVARVRAVCHKLKDNLNNDLDYIQYISEFVSNCAHQFAYSRIFRISHGALTPSNISTDGKWLDLTNTTFVPSGYNYRAGKWGTNFLSEKDSVVNFIIEKFYTFRKYTGVNINVRPLINYYYKKFNIYLSYYVVELFGLNYDLISNRISKNDIEKLSRTYTYLLENNTTPLRGVPTQDTDDGPIVSFIEDCFSILVGNKNNLYDIPGFDKCIQRIFLSAYQAEKVKYQNKINFIIDKSIKALRKVYFIPFFYVGRIYKESRIVVDNNISEINLYIESFKKVTLWVFDKEDNDRETIIFQSSAIKIIYIASSSTYIVHNFLTLTKPSIETEKNLKFSSLSVLNSYLDDLTTDSYLVCGYNFKPQLFRLIGMIRILKRSENKIDF